MSPHLPERQILTRRLQASSWKNTRRSLRLIHSPTSQSLNKLHLSDAKGGGFAGVDYGCVNEMYQAMLPQ
jgi:hypothetical protein